MVFSMSPRFSASFWLCFLEARFENSQVTSGLIFYKAHLRQILVLKGQFVKYVQNSKVALKIYGAAYQESYHQLLYSLLSLSLAIAKATVR